MSEISLKDLKDTDLSKILGLTVDINIKNEEKTIIGMIYSLLKNNNFLIRKIKENKK